MGYAFAIAGLSLLIIVHELGHMWVARLFGMRVLTFSVGFGPTLLRFRGRDTVYQLALIPLGGFVQIAGMNPHEPLPEDDPGSYANKGAVARIATILAGPLTNYLVAALLMIAIIAGWGMPTWQHMVGKVVEDSPAAKAGLLQGDQISSVGGKPTPKIPDVVNQIRASKGQPVPVQVTRDGKQHRLTVTPQREKDSEDYRIGIGFSRKVAFTEVSTGAAVLLGLYYPVQESVKGLSALGNVISKLFSGDTSGAKQVGGVVEIVYQLSESFKQSIALALIFLVMISAWLALLNLLPVPALDGGRLLFLIASVAIRRPINQRVEHAIHTAGFLLLLSLIMLITYCDVARRMGGP